MITGKTSTGYEFRVDERTINDWRFVKAIAKAESNVPSDKIVGLNALCEMLLGEEGEEQLMKQLASENDGFVPQEQVYGAVVEIINIVKEQNEKTKNSSSSPE